MIINSLWVYIRLANPDPLIRVVSHGNEEGILDGETYDERKWLRDTSPESNTSSTGLDPGSPMGE